MCQVIPMAYVYWLYNSSNFPLPSDNVDDELIWNVEYKIYVVVKKNTVNRRKAESIKIISVKHVQAHESRWVMEEESEWKKNSICWIDKHPF